MSVSEERHSHQVRFPEIREGEVAWSSEVITMPRMGVLSDKVVYLENGHIFTNIRALKDVLSNVIFAC